jgi:hypothetical protein
MDIVTQNIRDSTSIGESSANKEKEDRVTIWLIIFKSHSFDALNRKPRC